MKSIDDLTFVDLQAFVESCGGWGDVQERLERTINEARRMLDAEGFPIQMTDFYYREYFVSFRQLETFREYFRSAVTLENAGKSNAADIAAGQALIRRKAFNQLCRILDRFPDWPMHNDSNHSSAIAARSDWRIS